MIDYQKLVEINGINTVCTGDQLKEKKNEACQNHAT